MLAREEIITAIFRKAKTEGIDLESLGIYDESDLIDKALIFFFENLEDVEEDLIIDLIENDYDEEIIYGNML